MVDIEGEAKKALAEVSGLDPEVPVRPLVTGRHAADVLLRAAREADLLVVGSRGHGGFASALLGSVSPVLRAARPLPGAGAGAA